MHVPPAMAHAGNVSEADTQSVVHCPCWQQGGVEGPHAIPSSATGVFETAEWYAPNAVTRMLSEQSISPVGMQKSPVGTSVQSPSTVQDWSKLEAAIMQEAPCASAAAPLSPRLPAAVCVAVEPRLPPVPVTVEPELSDVPVDVDMGCSEPPSASKRRPVRAPQAEAARLRAGTGSRSARIAVL